MIRNVMEHIGGHIEAYPVISLVIFVSFFVGMLAYVLSMSRGHVQRMSNLPIETEPSGDTRHE